MKSKVSAKSDDEPKDTSMEYWLKQQILDGRSRRIIKAKIQELEAEKKESHSPRPALYTWFNVQDARIEVLCGLLDGDKK